MWHTWQVIPAGCSLYTDGSLIDARLGQGAELWALKQALTFVPFLVAIYVDCKTVVDGVRSGHQWIYSSKRRYHQH